MDREKVIKALQRDIRITKRDPEMLRHVHYGRLCYFFEVKAVKSAIDLLKEQDELLYKKQKDIDRLCNEISEWKHKYYDRPLKEHGEHMARILTLDEALGSEDPVFFESEGRMECWVDAYLSNDLQCAVLYRFTASEFMLALKSYGKTWRCWDKRPTEEEKKAEEWI